MIKKKPAKRGLNLRTLRAGMTRANEKFKPGGRPNPNFKVLPLRLPPEKR